MREIADLGYAGGYIAVTDFLREVRPPPQAGFERRFETPPGRQAQVDFAHFKVVFDDEPGRVRAVWLFAMVLANVGGRGGGQKGRRCYSDPLNVDG